MTLRERLADWISGGALTRARGAAERYRRIARQQHITTGQSPFVQGIHAPVMLEQYRAFLAVKAFEKIAACETPNANATVRRMAKIAREARE